MKVLVIQQRYGIGDMVILLPYIHAISKKFNTPVSLLAKESSRASSLLADDSHVDEIITLDKEKDGISGFFKLSNELKKRSFDKVFIFNSSLRYYLVAKLSGIKSIYQYPLFRSKDNIVHSAKIFTENITGNIVSTEPNLKIKSTIDNLNKDFKHICLGISASGPTKRWNINNYIKLCEELSKIKKCKFYVAGGKNDIKLINEFKKSEIGKNCQSFEELSIKETLPIIKNCNFSVCNDSSFSHLSAALSVKTITLMADTPLIYGSYNSKMFPIIPDGKNDVGHNTLGKEKINPQKIFDKKIEIIN